MRKILFVNDEAYEGGTEKVLHDITCNLNRSEYDITIMTFNRCKEFNQYYSSDITYWYMYEREMLTSSNLIQKCIHRVQRDMRKAQITGKINRAGFDVIVAIKEGHIMKYVSTLHAPKKVGWIHTDFNVLHWSDWCFDVDEELACMQTFDCIVCVSETVKAHVIQQVGNPGNMKCIMNPIDAEDIRNKAKAGHPEIHRSIGKTLFVTVGRLCYEKGYDMLLNAAAKLTSEGYSFEVWIVGGGEDEAQLQEQLNRLQLENVHMLGLQKNPYSYIREADWFLSASRAEGYAIVPQEAAILGIPVIATDCSGVRELLGDNEYGMIIEISEEAILGAMRYVLEHPEEHQKYQTQIQERAKTINMRQRMEAIEAVL